MQDIAGKYGPTSIAWAVPDLPLLRQGGYSRLASATNMTWVDCAGFGDLAAPCADFLAYGWPMGEIYTSLVKEPRITLVWGANPAETDWRRMRVIMEAKSGGSRLVAIDPHLSRTARRADQHVPVRPGTDGALALGMINIIIEQGFQDEEFIREYTAGPLLVREDNGLFLRERDISPDGNKNVFMVYDQTTGQPQRSDTPDIKPALAGEYQISGTRCRPSYQLLKDMAAGYTPEVVSNITDVPADVIRHLAIEYATKKPAAIHRGWGMQRTFYGDLACRAISALAAITGNMNPRRPSRFVLNTRSFLMPAGWYNRIPIMMLYDAVTKEEPLAIKAIFFAGRNYINQLPNMNRIIDELLPGLELIVVCDLFMTETAKYADYVLPVASFLECVDLVPGGSAWVPYLQLQQKVIEPLHECKSDFEIAAELGRRMGAGQYFDKAEEQYIEELLASGHPSMEGVTLHRLKEGPVEAESAERPPEFRTSTGRIEFYTERLRQYGQELPAYIEPVESARQEKAKKYPLSLISPHSRYRLHSSMVNVPHLSRHDPGPFLEINPQDAEQRGIGDGDVVRVFNDRGRVKLKVRLAEGIKPGVVAITEGWWTDQYIEGNLNQLTHDMINPAQQSVLGPNAALCDVLVEVEK
jgi:molybdopterin-containing oxidoreductase family molybdopterin binding subunit